MKMRFRTDGWHYADLKTHGWRFANFMGEQGDKVYGSWITEQEEFDTQKRDFDSVPKAEPGDVWRVFWHGGQHIAGYAICCLGCGHVHAWTTANNCQYKVVTRTYAGPDSRPKTYQRCSHDLERGSCWNWSGSAEDGTLTTSPSLLNRDCGWHGFIQNGDIHT